jgi:hypothetical protein
MNISLIHLPQHHIKESLPYPPSSKPDLALKPHQSVLNNTKEHCITTKVANHTPTSNFIVKYKPVAKQ